MSRLSGTVVAIQVLAVDKCDQEGQQTETGDADEHVGRNQNGLLVGLVQVELTVLQSARQADIATGSVINYN